MDNLHDNAISSQFEIIYNPPCRSGYYALITGKGERIPMYYDEAFDLWRDRYSSISPEYVYTSRALISKLNIMAYFTDTLPQEV